MSSGGPELSSGTITSNPVVLLGGRAQLVIQLSTRKNAVFITLGGELVSGETIMTLENEDGDYEVPAGKEFFPYLAAMVGTSGQGFALGFGDDAVTPGTTDPATPKFILGENNVGGALKSAYIVTNTAETKEFAIATSPIPSGKFPFWETNSGANSKFLNLYGVEVDNA